MGRSVYGRDAFEDFRTCYVILLLTATAFFSAAHAVDVFRRWKKIKTGRRNSFNLKISILACNLVALFILIPFVMVHYFISVDDDVYTCRNVLYRVLLYRSQAYDVMKEYSRFFSFVWWAVHTLCPLLLIILPIYLGTGEFEILTQDVNEGSRMCVVRRFTLMPFLTEGWVAGLMVACMDFAVSLGCLALLILPIFQSNFRLSTDVGVVRNIVFSSIAIFSTFGFLVTTSVFEVTEGFWSVGFLLDLGIFDVIMNLICINLCWPISFYYKFVMLCLGLKPAAYKDSKNPKNRKHHVIPMDQGSKGSKKPKKSFRFSLTIPTRTRQQQTASLGRPGSTPKSITARTSVSRFNSKTKSRSKIILSRLGQSSKSILPHMCVSPVHQSPLQRVVELYEEKRRELNTNRQEDFSTSAGERKMGRKQEISSSAYEPYLAIRRVSLPRVRSSSTEAVSDSVPNRKLETITLTV
ncbi:hypothetical protein AAMO2058_000166700 [Amorphochlora amoebiformis]